MQEVQIIEIDKRYEVKDFEITKQDFENAVAKFKKWEIQDNEIDDAKKARANLNNASKAIKQDRLANANRILGTYTTQCKEIEKLIDEASKALDIQIKNYETKGAEEKKEKIDKLILKITKDKSWVELKAIASLREERLSKWLLKGSKFEDIEFELNKYLEKINTEVQTLISVVKDNERNKVLNFYVASNYNVSSTIAMLQEDRKKNDTTNLVGEVPSTNSKPKEIDPNAEKEQEFIIAFRVKGTKTQILDLEQFLNNNGMLFEQIKN